MTTNLTATPSRTSITNNQPSAALRCGLNETAICCKESETAHHRVKLLRADTARRTVGHDLDQERPNHPNGQR